MNGDFKLLHIKGDGNRRNFLVEYLISIGVNVEVVEHTKEIRGIYTMRVLNVVGVKVS